MFESHQGSCDHLLQSRLISVLPMPMRPNENKMSDRASYNGVHKQ